MSKFNVGDKVRVVNDHGIWLETAGSSYPDSTILTVVDDDCATLEDSEIFIGILEQWSSDFELVFSITQEDTVRCDPPEVIIPITRDKSETLGVYRPDVENRKADKIRIELFDDGFPNAILEIAKVLTWAQKVKGYKDHDWVNLPDAENSLKGAASRHRRDANQQKMEGVPAKERVDHESKHHHLAHQAFNILAELELILTGKIT